MSSVMSWLQYHDQDGQPPCVQFAPSREAFFDKIHLPPGADLMPQLEACLLAFGTALGVVHKFYVEHNLDDPAPV